MFPELLTDRNFGGINRVTLGTKTTRLTRRRAWKIASDSRNTAERAEMAIFVDGVDNIASRTTQWLWLLAMR
jgi:hypothetical protein